MAQLEALVAKLGWKVVRVPVVCSRRDGALSGAAIRVERQGSGLGRLSGGASLSDQRLISEQLPPCWHVLGWETWAVLGGGFSIHFETKWAFYFSRQWCVQVRRDAKRV